MRRVCLTAAAGVVVLANGWGVLQAWRNRSEPRGGQLELTERELGLQSMGTESTATVLRLNWSVRTRGDEEYGPAAWLDTNKLVELGFDCSVPVDSLSARHHYTSMPSRPVFLALEYEGAAEQSADAKAKAGSRLFVVDAARDIQSLRERYPNYRRHIICRGLVRLGFQDRDRRAGTPLSPPRLEGWIEGLRPGELSVPLPYSRLLGSLRRAEFEGGNDRQPKEPRFAVRVCWGADYEPWVEGVRLLGATDADVKRP